MKVKASSKVSTIYIYALHNNPKRFWSLFKLYSKRASVPEKVTMGSTGGDSVPAHSACSPGDIAEFFNDYFLSIVSGSDLLSNCDNPTAPSDCTLSELILFPEDVLAVLVNLDTNKATGPDEIPPRILKNVHTTSLHLSVCYSINPSNLAPYPTNENYLTSYLSTKKVMRLTSKTIVQSPFFV